MTAGADVVGAEPDSHPFLTTHLALGGDAGDLFTGRADLALVGVAGEPPGHLSAEVIVSEGLVALVTEDHPLATKKQVPLTEIATYAVVTLPEGTGIRAAFDEACVTASLIPDVALVASAPGAVADLASRGMGIAVLSESMAAAYPHLVAVAITGVDIAALLALVWRRKTGPALSALLPHLRREFGLEPHES